MTVLSAEIHIILASDKLAMTNNICPNYLPLTERTNN